MTSISSANIAIKPIHTLNARGNIMLEVTRDYFQLNSARMFLEIQALRQQVEDALALKNIKYDALKSALVPAQDKQEIALIFDSTETQNNWYGLEIFKRLLPLFDKRSNHSVLSGDYGANCREDLLYEAMSEAVILNRACDYKHSTQFCIVYINNLSSSMIEQFTTGLSNYRPYIGYANTTYDSRFKLFVSMMLPNIFLKHGKIILQGHEDDRPNTEDINMCGYPFEDFGYVCKSIQSYLKDTMLAYKIERPVYKGFEIDTEFALNAVNKTPLPLDGFTIYVDEAKLEYIKKEKSGSIARAGLEKISMTQLKELIMAKISASYIYNMAYNPEHDVTKFNIIIEVPDNKTRLMASLEYKPEEKKLRLITLY